MSIKIHESWAKHLEDEFEKDYFKNLTTFVREEYQHERIYPAPKNIFRAFDLCPFDQIKVVILGQDPYHGPGQANGLCFSVNDGVDLPPSLQNIYKELHADLGIPIRDSGVLDDWARQGVLLLNATLTVQAHRAGSHQRKGWEEFTDSVIQKISDECRNVVFILWGNYAQEKGKVIDETKHLVIRSPHPSPLSASRGFFGSQPFSQTNDYLEWNEKKSINW
jgi:uracil-DNA glycosylase